MFSTATLGGAAADEAEFGSGGIDGDLEVVAGLEVEPELRGSAKELCQAQRGIGGYAAAALDDFRNALRWDTQFAGEGVAAEVQGLHEVLQEVFAGVDGGQKFGHG